MMSKLEKLRGGGGGGGGSEYEQSKLSIDQSIQRLEEAKLSIMPRKKKIRLLVEEMEREKAKLSTLMRQGEVLHAQGLKHQEKIISLGVFQSSMSGKAADLTSQL